MIISSKIVRENNFNRGQKAYCSIYINVSVLGSVDRCGCPIANFFIFKKIIKIKN